MPYTPSQAVDLSPVKLNYIGALKGLRPHSMSDKITYAAAGDFDPELLVGLAASNPHGIFYGVVQTEAQAKDNTDLAGLRHINNICFITDGTELPNDLQYFCYQNTSALLAPSDNRIFEIAAGKLAQGGYFAIQYKAYNDPADCLGFLISEYAPYVQPDKALSFMLDIKALGTDFFNDRPELLDKINAAITARDADAFLKLCASQDGTPATCGTLAVMEQLLPRDFSFVGDANVQSNYMELVAPSPSHGILEKCKDELLYEPIKDFVLQRTLRNDVWVKRPVEQTFDNAALYGNFTFGITMSEDKVPASIETKTGPISLSSVLFKRLVSLMTTLPLGIGDFLHHPAGQGMEPDEVVAAINILVACGIAQPMRGRYEGVSPGKAERYMWACPYNEYLNLSEISRPTVTLASPVTGTPMSVPARDALVLQAINRVGLVHCAGALQPVLAQIIEKNPSLAAQITETTEITDDMVRNIVSDTVSNNMGRWFAYGILAA